MTDRAIRVIKVGGSVLTSPRAYRRVAQHVAARLIEAPGERLAVVVSAELGVTDALLQTAKDFSPDPDPATVDLLWSTGELKSVALLALALQALGVRATTANVHQLGLSHDLTSSASSMLRLRAALAQSEVVVIPGFLARGHGDAIVSLGRGGSDLTAVFLAAQLRAAECELVQPRALEVARQFHVNILIRALDDERRTIVTASEKGHVNGVRDTHDTCGAAV